MLSVAPSRVSQLGRAGAFDCYPRTGVWGRAPISTPKSFGALLKYFALGIDHDQVEFFGTQAPGFEQPRINIVFDRLPADKEATKLTYAEQSGITVYGSAVTRFLYEVTNTVRDGRAPAGFWDTSKLSAGDYILRIIAADYSGNEAQEGRDLRNEGRAEDGEAPKTTEPGTGAK